MPFSQASLPRQQPGTTITAVKSARATLTETNIFHWSLSKTVTPGTLVIPRGECRTAEFSILATRTLVSELLVTVQGEVCVTNEGMATTQGLTIVDRIQQRIDGGPWTDVEGTTQIITPSQQVPPGETVCFRYATAFPAVFGPEFRNVADVTITNFTDHIGAPFGVEAIRAFTVPTTPSVVSNIDETAGLADLVNCPFEFVCEAALPGPLILTETTIVPVSVQVCNENACDLTRTLNQQATLVTADTGTTVHAEANVTIIAPSCLATATRGLGPFSSRL